MTFHVGDVVCTDTGETYRVTSIFQQPGTGGFGSQQCVDATLDHGDVVEDVGWPGYLWGVESMKCYSGSKANGGAKVRLELLLPPPYVPWRNAPKVIYTDSHMLEGTNAMEVLAHVRARDDSPRAVQKRKKSYKKVCKEIGRLRSKIQTSKRPKAKEKARERLRELGKKFTEITKMEEQPFYR